MAKSDFKRARRQPAKRNRPAEPKPLSLGAYEAGRGSKAERQAFEMEWAKVGPQIADIFRDFAEAISVERKAAKTVLAMLDSNEADVHTLRAFLNEHPLAVKFLPEMYMKALAQKPRKTNSQKIRDAAVTSVVEARKKLPKLYDEYVQTYGEEKGKSNLSRLIWAANKGRSI